MKEEYTVKLSRVVEELSLSIIHASTKFAEDVIRTPDVNRPGLQLTGFYDRFEPERVQVFGKVETAYMNAVSKEERLFKYERLMSSGIRAMVICHALDPMPECKAAAEKYDVNLLGTDEDTSRFIAGLIASLAMHLAERITMHGVLVEVHGEGILITGDSGIGKSETALELVKRGHRLIADDAVEIKRASRVTLVGYAPEIIRYYMEVRGIGIIDVRNIFGAASVKPITKIDMIADLKEWNESVAYDRLGLEPHYMTVMDIEVPYTVIPVLPGRNLAVLLEVAAVNNRQKRMGYNAAKVLTERHDDSISKGWMD
ncbi:MAG: HPr(Ser) kinase/phosphatase [Oscillospiraceae bacterium]|nr:HPr(Ser) kinase/phosphatase [Oscillospiraceae bacterium]